MAFGIVMVSFFSLGRLVFRWSIYVKLDASILILYNFNFFLIANAINLLLQQVIMTCHIVMFVILHLLFYAVSIDLCLEGQFVENFFVDVKIELDLGFRIFHVLDIKFALSYLFNCNSFRRINVQNTL